MIKNKKQKANTYSDFWIVDKFDTSKYDSLIVDRTISGYMKLAAMRRSIADFVKIVTGKRIPVEFMTKDVSMTEGKTVYISAKIEDGNLDSTVGLALHEGSHVLLTDFKVLELLKYSISDEIYKKAEAKGCDKEATVEIVKNLLNWTEDRRIDNYIYKNAPGYRGYYHALYDRYFNSDIVTEALQSDAYRTEDADSYLYRITNITNENTDLTALNGLKLISETIGLKNIDRLKSTAEALSVSLNVFDIILDNVDAVDSQKYRQQNAQLIYDPTGKLSKGAGNSKIKLTKQQLEELLKQIKKQRDFLNGQIEKVHLSGNDLSKLNHISNAGTELKNIQVPMNPNQKRTYDSLYNVSDYTVVVIKRVTEEMFDSDILPFATRGEYGIDDNIQAVADGIRLGTQLGRKLLIRNEERLTKYTRKEHGKIDRRLISELGFNNESVFQQTFVEMYADAILHMSIDVSGSMSGKKLLNAIKTVTAICQAASMTNGNLDIVVDVRSTDYDENPFVAIVYDSRVDKMTKVKKLFPRIVTCGTTPEGLCFAAIQDLISASTTKLNSYFLNLSDGEPYFHGYSGRAAAEHTRVEVNKMRQKGVKVLSYFITEGKYGHHEQFQLMYGNSASYINTNSLLDIATTLNKLFLSKD